MIWFIIVSSAPLQITVTSSEMLGIPIKLVLTFGFFSAMESMF